MRFRFPAWLVLLLLAAVCGGLVALVSLLRGRGASTAELLARLPADDAILLCVDFQALRRAGVLDLLAESTLAQEPEYQAFVQQSGFDYRERLEAVLISFHRDGNFLLLRGRFDWGSLNDFVQRQGGTCWNTFCRVAGSSPERKISYFPAWPDVMALAVSKDEWAAARMQTRRPETGAIEVPAQPVWSVLPVGRLGAAEDLPAGTRLFAKALGVAERIVLSAGPKGDGLELLLEVTCRSAQDAAALLSQLRGITATLDKLIAGEKQKPNPRDLSGVITRGLFEQHDQRVMGRWPLERAFLETLAGGGI
ncbi:MAG: hypothetical protein AAB225_04135 [Acidobacteriota bacterium]